MQFKTTIEGNLIYAAMIVLVIGLILSVLRKSKWSVSAAFGAFVVLSAAWIIRWIHAGHLPMQTMFEVFLTLGVCLFPIGVLARNLNASKTFVLGDIVTDSILALITLFPAGFIFTDQPQTLPSILKSPLFGPHVLAYLLSYVLMTKAAIYAAAGFVQKKPEYEQSACLLSCLGFPLMCVGLMLGSVWGLLAWGDWWNWDPKELWSLACVLVYAFYFHWRSLLGQKYPRLNCLWVILGFILIVITLLWVNLSPRFPGLHNYAG
jgi:ABC-type transport system involved in cytochrome c biogenesis permease subunit